MSKIPVIEINGMSKSYAGKRVVDNVSLSIDKGEVVGFLGPNGSGKTTTMRMMCGLVTPDCGSGRCLGYDLKKDAHVIKPLVGYMT